MASRPGKDKLLRAAKADGFYLPSIKWREPLVYAFTLSLERQVERDSYAWPRGSRASKQNVEQSEDFALLFPGHNEPYKAISTSHAVLAKRHYGQILRKKLTELRKQYDDNTFGLLEDAIRVKMAFVLYGLDVERKRRVIDMDDDEFHEEGQQDVKKDKEVRSTVGHWKGGSPTDGDSARDANTEEKEDDQIDGEIPTRQHRLT